MRLLLLIFIASYCSSSRGVKKWRQHITKLGAEDMGLKTGPFFKVLEMVDDNKMPMIRRVGHVSLEENEELNEIYSVVETLFRSILLIVDLDEKHNLGLSIDNLLKLEEKLDGLKTTSDVAGKAASKGELIQEGDMIALERGHENLKKWLRARRGQYRRFCVEEFENAEKVLKSKGLIGDIAAEIRLMAVEAEGSACHSHLPAAKAGQSSG
jgi:hypothetical protein